MKKNAFTLLELLGVVIILGVLTLITFPIILNQIKDAKQGIKDSTKTLIIDAAKDYYEDNTNNFEKIEGITYCIDIKTLTDENYLSRNLKNENLNNIDTNKKVKLIFHNNKFNYEIVDSCTHYTVTFDANGGSVDIDSKEVIENSTYGTLPTPTRAGYTFMGWNGKNIFDMTGWLNSFTKASRGTVEKGENSITLTATGNDAYTDTYYNAGSFRIAVNPNENYTFSWDSDSNIAGLQYVFINGKTSTGYMYNGNNGVSKSIRFTTTNDAEYINIRLGVYRADDSITYSNIQIEEGDTATEYEPYFVTSKTKVTRNFNHTLKAIWKENE